jgi:hypothetical protein
MHFASFRLCTQLGIGIKNETIFNHFLQKSNQLIKTMQIQLKSPHRQQKVQTTEQNFKGQFMQDKKHTPGTRALKDRTTFS